MAAVTQRAGVLVFRRTADRHAGLDGLGIRDDRFHLPKQRTSQCLRCIVTDALAGCLHLLEADDLAPQVQHAAVRGLTGNVDGEGH